MALDRFSDLSFIYDIYDCSVSGCLGIDGGVQTFIESTALEPFYEYSQIISFAQFSFYCLSDLCVLSQEVFLMPVELLYAFHYFYNAGILGS